MDGASSIAGLVSLSGLVLQSASFLYRFCSKYKNLAEEIQSVVQDITRLQSVLQHVERTIQDDLETRTHSSEALTELQIETKECETDLSTWLQALQQLHQTDQRPSKRIVEKLKAAAHEGRFTQMRVKISSHRQQLELRLAHMNVSFGIHNHRLHQQMHKSIDEVRTDLSALQRETNNNKRSIQSSIDNLEHNALHHVDNGIQQIISCSQIESRSMLNHIDARLQTFQQQILSTMPSLHKRKVVKRLNGKRLMASSKNSLTVGYKVTSAGDALIKEEVTSRCATYLIQIVEPGILITGTNGQLHQRLVAVPVNDHDESTLSKKLSFILHIQGLRVLIWLLRRNPVIPVYTFYGAKDFSSELLIEGQLNHEIEKRETVYAVMLGVQGLLDRATLIFLAERHWIWGDILGFLRGTWPESVKFIWSQWPNKHRTIQFIIKHDEFRKAAISFVEKSLTNKNGTSNIWCIMVLQYISYHGISDIYHFGGSRSSSSDQRTTEFNQGLRHLELKYMLEADANLGPRKTTEDLLHCIKTVTLASCLKEFPEWVIEEEKRGEEIFDDFSPSEMIQ